MNGACNMLAGPRGIGQRFVVRWINLHPILSRAVQVKYGRNLKKNGLPLVFQPLWNTALVICIGVVFHGRVWGQLCHSMAQLLEIHMYRYWADMLYLQCTHCMFPHGNGWLQEDNAAPHKSKVAAAFHANKGFLGLLKVQILTQLRIFGLWSSKAFTSKRKTFKS